MLSTLRPFFAPLLPSQREWNDVDNTLCLWSVEVAMVRMASIDGQRSWLEAVVISKWVATFITQE